MAYVANAFSNSVAVMDTATNTITAIIPVGFVPLKVTLDPAGTRAYVTNYGLDAVSVIDTATNTVTATIGIGALPAKVALDPAGSRAYVTNNAEDSVSVIDTATASVVATIPTDPAPWELAVTPNGDRVYVTHDAGSDTVSVIDTATNTVLTTLSGFTGPWGVAVDANGTYAYVTEIYSSALSVIDVATNTVVDTIHGFGGPYSLTLIDAPGPSYNFTGFFPPVDNRPTFNRMKAGRAVPVRFSLGGDHGLGIFAAGSPSSRNIDCKTGAPMDRVEETSAADGSSLSYDPATDTYTYEWKTMKAWAGTCRALVLKLDDGSTHSARFKFT